jgi:hypothetical protein
MPQWPGPLRLAMQLIMHGAYRQLLSRDRDVTEVSLNWLGHLLHYRVCNNCAHWLSIYAEKTLSHFLYLDNRLLSRNDIWWHPSPGGRPQPGQKSSLNYERRLFHRSPILRVLAQAAIHCLWENSSCTFISEQRGIWQLHRGHAGQQLGCRKFANGQLRSKLPRA